MSFVTDIVHQARDIYLGQVQLGDDYSPLLLGTATAIKEIRIAKSIGCVQHFKETLEAFPHGSPGEQVLVWATFMAASAC